MRSGYANALLGIEKQSQYLGPFHNLEAIFFKVAKFRMFLGNCRGAYNQSVFFI